MWQYYGPITGTTFFNRLAIFLLFKSNLIFQTSNHEEILYENSLISCPSHSHKHVFASWQTLCHQTLFLTVHFYAVHGYAAIHMHITHVTLPFHSATTMQLHHVLILICLFQTVLIDLVQTCTYNMIVYKIQGIDWHPQSDSLGVSPSKADSINSPLSLVVHTIF